MAKVLLVEDDNNLREIYEARLLAEGYEIVTAKDGEDALAAAKQSKPDLIISDVMMPRISGFEMLDILRNTEGLKNVKIVMLTALGQADDRERAQSMGADRYLVKSQVTLEDIVKTAEELLDPDYVPPSEETSQPEPAQGTLEAQASMPGVTPLSVDAAAAAVQTPSAVEPTLGVAPETETAAPAPQPAVESQPTTPPASPAQPEASAPSPVTEPAAAAPTNEPVVSSTPTPVAPDPVQPVIQSFGEPVMPVTQATSVAQPAEPVVQATVASNPEPAQANPEPAATQPSTNFMNTLQPTQPQIPQDDDKDADDDLDSDDSTPPSAGPQQSVYSSFETLEPAQAAAPTESPTPAQSEEPAEKSPYPELTLPSIGGSPMPQQPQVVAAPETIYADPSQEHPHMPVNSEEAVAADAQTTEQEAATIGQQINNFVENEQIPQIRIDDSVNEPTMVTLPPDDNGPDEELTPAASDEREELISSALNELLSNEDSQPTEVLAEPTPTPEAVAPASQTAETPIAAEPAQESSIIQPATEVSQEPVTVEQPAQSAEVAAPPADTVTPQSYEPQTVAPQPITPDPTPQPIQEAEEPAKQPSVSQIPGKKVIHPLGLPDDHKDINDLIAQEEIKENLEKGTTGAAIVSNVQESEPGVTQVPPQVTTQPTIPGGVFVPNSDGSAQEDAL